MSEEFIWRDELPAGEREELCDPGALIAMVKSDDRRALGRMTHCYRERLLRVGLKHCCTAAEAEDAVQDTFVSAAGNLDSFRADGSLEGWLSRIVINCCRRGRRGRKNDPTLHTTEARLEAPQSSPERAAALSELRDALEEALEELDPESRAIVILSDAMGWRSPEIAEHFGVSPGSVRTRLHRLHKRLRAQLAVVYE